MKKYLHEYKIHEKQSLNNFLRYKLLEMEISKEKSSYIKGNEFIIFSLVLSAFQTRSISRSTKRMLLYNNVLETHNTPPHLTSVLSWIDFLYYIAASNGRCCIESSNGIWLYPLKVNTRISYITADIYGRYIQIVS